MSEKNSEKKAAIAAAVVSAVTALAVGLADAFGLNLSPATIGAIVVGLAGVVFPSVKYIDSRPKKHLAMAERVRAEARAPISGESSLDPSHSSR